MLRRTTQLLTLTLTLFASFALAAPRAEAINFVLIPDTQPITCTATVSANRTCTQTITFDSPGADLGTDLANAFELKTTVTQGTWDVTIDVMDFGNDTATAGFTGPNAIHIGNDGVLYISYSAFTGAPNPIDFDQLKTLTLTLKNQSAIGDSITISQVTAVPEPGTAGMLTLGLLGLAFASPRRRLAA